MAATELNNTILKNSANLKAYYRMESGALTTDSSGNGNTLGNNGSVSNTTGVFGSAADFSSTNSGKYLSIVTGPVTGTSARTIVGWCYQYQIDSGNQGFFGIGSSGTTRNTFSFYTAATSGEFLIICFADNLNSGVNVTAGTWFHAAITYDGSSVIRLYINGKHIGSKTLGGALNTDAVLTIGKSPYEVAYADGIVDDVSVFNIALTPDQIKELYEGRTLGELWPHGTPAARTREINSTVLKNGITAYYRMESGALTTDSSGNANTLTNNNTVGETTGVFGGAADVGASNTNKSLSFATSIITSATNFTISYWAKTANTSQNVKAMLTFGNSGANGIQIYQSNATLNGAGANIVVNYGGVTAINTTATFADTTSWRHIVLTRDTSTLRVYINGVFITSSTSTPNTPSGPTGIFYNAQSSAEYWSGIIDDVGIWNRALTSSEIQELYYQDGPPVALYHLNGNSTDFSGNNNHGTDTSVTYSLANGKFGQGGGFVTATPSRIALPTGVRQTGSFTFSAWIKPNTLTPANTEAIIHYDWSGSNKNFIIEQNNANLLFNTGNGSTSQDTALTAGVLTTTSWHHVVFVRNGTTRLIYQNGALVGSTTGSYSGGSTSNNLFIGSDSAASAGYGFGGAIDEVQIYNVAKSADWVRKQYALGVGKYL